MTARRRRLIAAAALLALPLGLLAACMAWLTAAHGAGVLGVTLHEDGQRTLPATVLYWRHFLREVPVAALYAVMVAGACAAYGPGPGRPRRSALTVCLVAAILLVGLAAIGAARAVGVRTALWDLLQAYVRDDQWAYGSHWRAHALSTLAFWLAAPGGAALLARAVDGAFTEPRRAARRRWLSGSLAALVVLSVVWWPAPEPLVDPRAIGHQAREAITHLVITLPLACGVWLLVHRDGAGSSARLSRPPAEVLAAGVGAAAIVAGLGAAVLVTRAVQVARPDASLSSLVAAHAFEHALDYVFVALLTAWCAGRSSAAT